MAMYRALDADKIIATIERLKRRIDERFPGAGLACVAGDLLAAAHDTEQKATSLRRQRWSYDCFRFCSSQSASEARSIFSAS
jgi:hypothetical protein